MHVADMTDPVTAVPFTARRGVESKPIAGVVHRQGVPARRRHVDVEGQLADILRTQPRLDAVGHRAVA